MEISPDDIRKLANFYAIFKYDEGTRDEIAWAKDCFNEEVDALFNKLLRSGLMVGINRPTSCDFRKKIMLKCEAALKK